MSEVRRNIVSQIPDAMTCLRRLDPAEEAATTPDPAAPPAAWYGLAIEGVLRLAYARLDAHRFVRAEGIDVARLRAFRDFASESLLDLAWVMSESLAQSPWPAQRAQRARAHEAYRSTVAGLVEQLDAVLADCTLPAAHAGREGVPAAVAGRFALLKEIEDAVVAHFSAGPGAPGPICDLDTIGWA
jgi:hypothetical protein